jgi:hypothetical protein
MSSISPSCRCRSSRSTICRQCRARREKATVIPGLPCPEPDTTVHYLTAADKQVGSDHDVRVLAFRAQAVATETAVRVANRRVKEHLVLMTALVSTLDAVIMLDKMSDM